MPCYHPLDVYQPLFVNDRWTRPVEFARPRGDRLGDYHSIKICCGQCIGCRQKRAGAWTIRGVHESTLYEYNAFITLTYRDENLPPGNSLWYPDFQKFMKRFKSAVRYRQGSAAADGIRFFMCGEYGENFGRPHYHAVIFNYAFADQYVWRRSPAGHMLYRSPFLEELWTEGFAEIGSVTFDSIAYVARYIFKMITGDQAADHYAWCDPETGEIFWRSPEFVQMSRRPGIAKAWFDRYYGDVFPHDIVVMNGGELAVPRYYSDLYERKTASVCNVDSRKHFSPQLDAVKFDRYLNALKNLDDNTPERLSIKKQCHIARLSRLKRTLV